MHCTGPSLCRAMVVSLLLGFTLSLLTLPITPVFSSNSTMVVASDAEQIVGVSTSGSPSMSTTGGQKLIEDQFGKFLAVYVNWEGRLSVTYANSNPSSSGSWSASTKSPNPTTYAYPAAVLVNSTMLRIVAENVTSFGLGHQGQIVDLPVSIQRGSGNNIVGLSFGNPMVLDSSNFAQFPTAMLAHNGDVLAGWNWFDGLSSRIKTLRWNQNAGSWTSITGSGTSPDDAIVDNSGLGAIYPTIIERQDNFNAYVIGLYDNAGPSNLVFNKASFSGASWSWETQNLSYETGVGHGIEDSASMAWDPVKNLVVACYRMTGAASYGVFTLTSSDNKTHLNTPSLSVSTLNNGSIAVNATNGDYYLFVARVASDGGTGSIAYTSAPSGSNSWNTTLTLIDSGSNNRGISLRIVGADKTFDLLYDDEGTVPSTIRIARVSAGFLPSALNADFTIAPPVPSPGQLTTLRGIATGGVPPYSFAWNFGDGTTGLGANVTHTYASTGKYLVRLNVTDSLGVIASREKGLVATSSVFEFAAAGDWDVTTETNANWQSLSTSGVNFTLALGDFLYSIQPTPQAQQSWCNNFKANAPGGNVEILVGNHETFEDNATSGGGSINKFVLYCPFTLGSLSGTYGFQYYFDYPFTAPLARFILVDPAIWLGNTSATRVLYGDGSPAQQWVAAQIDSARGAGIQWVIVGMHKDCISAGVEGCEVGEKFMSFLINKRVDLVIQGHDHNYQRSKQLTCATPQVYLPSCVINDGSSSIYQKGAGTVFLIDGTGGATLDKINATDGDYGYFARTNSTTWGYTKVYVSGSSLQVQFVPTSGAFSDTWYIVNPYIPVWLPDSSLNANNVGPKSLTLSWTPAIDVVQVSTYKLYKNGTLLATLPGAVTNYNVNGLTPYSHYLFQVQAGNPSGGWTFNGPSTLIFTYLKADINHDCNVNGMDLAILGASFLSTIGSPAYNPNADVNGDGVINGVELAILGAGFLRTC